MSELMRHSNAGVSVSNPFSHRGRLARDTERALDVIQAQSEVSLGRIQAATEEAAAVVHARNTLAAAAAQDDAVLSGFLNALPIYGPTDADFRSQLQHCTRAGVIGDVLSFRP